LNIEIFREYCLKKPGCEESLPFDNDTLAFKIYNKIFALCSLDNFVSINLKCDPEKAIQLREKYADTVLPGYHMNKKHWNTVLLNKQLNDKTILELVDHSYDLIKHSIPKAKRLP